MVWILCEWSSEHTVSIINDRLTKLLVTTLLTVTTNIIHSWFELIVAIFSACHFPSHSLHSPLKYKMPKNIFKKCPEVTCYDL